MQPSKDKNSHSSPLLSESSDNNRTHNQNLIHHIEDDVPPPLLSEPPKNIELNAQTAQSSRLKTCFDSDKRREMVDIILFCFFLIFVFGVFALIIALSAYHFSKTDTNLSPISGALSYIAFSLGSRPILDIKIQDNSIPCPEDYEKIVLGAWPGTVAGCLCGLTLQGGPCDNSGDDPRDKGCDDVVARSPIDMFDWKDDKWCVLRAKPQSQYKRTISCAEGYRKCSPGLCLINSLDCPVTGIKKEGDSFITEIIKEESPMIDMRITPNNISCFGVESFAHGPTPPYMLIDEDERGCSKYGLDNGYSFFLDSEKQGELFVQNDFPSYVLEMIDYRKVYEQTDAILSFRKRLNVTEKDFCLNIDTELLKEAPETMVDMQNFMSEVLIAGIIINSILCLWVVTFIMIFVFCCSLGQQQSHRAKILFGGSLIIGLMRNIDIIVMFGVMVHYRSKILEMKEYFGEISECFLDEKTQSVVGDYQVVGDEVSWILLKYSILLFVVSTVSIFPSFCLFWRIKKRDS